MSGVDQRELPKSLLLAFAPIHKTALGVAVGAVVGGLLFLMTLLVAQKGGYPQPNLWLLAQFLPGYRLTAQGAFMGLAWGFAVGFLLGWGIAFCRNVVVWIWLTIIRSRAEMEQYNDFLDHL